ncbi:MAG TPA: twin-arginine translocation signal domain-containing protein, partial [Bacteroidales bacterium]|nr:twin-arginine translocation signal domain-containing protein [Bacteroidales bacterium]
MDRRDFIKTSSALGALTIPGIGINAFTSPDKNIFDLPRYRGFNLLAKFSGHEPRRQFEEEDFEIMAGWGFDFARIPMSYWNWASKDDWYAIDEDIMKD